MILAPYLHGYFCGILGAPAWCNYGVTAWERIGWERGRRDAWDDLTKGAVRLAFEPEVRAAMQGEGT